VRVIFEDNSGILWIGTQRGINRFNRNKETFTRFKYKKNNLGCLNSSDINVFYEDSQQAFWIGTSNKGLYKFDKNKELLSQYKNQPGNPHSLSHNCVNTIYEDCHGTLWVGTFGGLNQFVEENGTFIRYTHNPRNLNTVSHNRIIDIYEDFSGILWIATLGGGLSRINQYKSQFEHYSHNSHNPNSLSHNFIYPIFEDSKGILWIGTAGGGLNRYDRKNSLFTHYQHDLNDSKSICHNIVRSICEDKSGFLWIATEGGLSRLRKNNWKKKSFFNFFHDPNNPESLSSNYVLSVLVDRDGALWVGTSDGLDSFESKTGTFIHYIYNPIFFNYNNVWTIYENRDGVFWLGTWGQGFNRFDKKKGEFIRYTHDPKIPDCVSHNIVTSFFEDKDKLLWIGTYGGGLNRFNRDTGNFKHYTTKDGLADNVVYGILPDNNGNLWMSTNKGLSRFNPGTETFRNYEVEDGLQSNEFNRAAYFKNRKGRMYFGGINGFNTFWMVAQKEGIVLPFNLNYFSFEFAALDYTAPEKNQYAYLLEGVDSDWIYCGTRRYAAYTSLNPGNYIFRVKGSNNDRIWNEKGISIPITISPPFWKRWWFTLIWVSLIAMILFLIFYFTFRYITLLKEKARAERFAAVGKFASYFAHDIKSPLEGTYLIASQMREMFSSRDEKREYLDDVIVGIDRMRNLVKGALDFSRASKPRMEPTDLNLLIQNIASEFQKINPCEISLQMEKKLPLILLDSSLMKRVFANLFENSFQARKDRCLIKVSTEIKDKKILVEVKDNGKGIRKEIISKIFEPFSSDKEKGHGFGLAFVKETIKSHGGTIKVKSEVDRGATFFIKFPAN
jgi:ligand-binding sensor domain-containing protein/signal transduction histidine kinase